MFSKTTVSGWLPADNLYARWRTPAAASVLQETTPLPPERLLQALWHHQRIHRDTLQTTDGRSLRVLHPGFWNREPGPDFRQAVVQIGGQVRTGDIEIDLHHAGWREHQHDRNPHFQNVILHVVWDAAQGQPMHPDVLSLKPVLDAPLEEIAAWLGSEAALGWPRELTGQCCAPLRDLPTEKLAQLLQQAAIVRLQRKAEEMAVRARQAGWEQALWEHLFRALGYKHNAWPMRRLAELRPRLGGPADPAPLWQARLLGLAGLLPDGNKDDTRVGELPVYGRQLWEMWWRERDRLADFILPKAAWKFSGLRPANHPQRRLALAAHWLARKNFLPALENWFLAVSDPEAAALSLRELLQASDDFWSWHWTFRSVRLSSAQPLLGAQRTTDLAINVLLPWFWIRAAVGKNLALQQKAETLWQEWPAAEDNAVLKLARRRLLGTNAAKLFSTASQQQGLLQIVRDFCEHSDALCTQCRFPDLVRSFSGSQKP